MVLIMISNGGRKYHIKGCAGQGGFAQVYKACVNSDPNDVVALKIQNPAFPWKFYMYRQLDMRITGREVELVKLTGQKVSSSHILEVYRGSLSQLVKKHRHDTLSLHAAGKHLAKGEASSRVLHHLVVEDFLVEEVKKSDFYGSVSSILKVNDPKVRNLFPSSIKASKLAKYEFTPAKGSLTSGKQNSHQIDTPAQPQTQVDMATILGESGDNVLGHHVFCNSLLQLMSKKVPRTKEKLLELNGMSKAKVSNYGDQILETIENTINEYYKLDKSSNGSADSAKRRRDANGGLDRNLEDDDELTKKIKM
ncbi:ATP-dependent DNA helicase Q-like 4A [Arachis hypogaea]|nr:ATP-dependent DNA helicase Q-like 4A [Arachis hypogaea]